MLFCYEDWQLLFLLTVEETPAETEPKFNPFCGTGRRLDGKPLKYEPPPLSSSGSKDKKPDVPNSQSSASSSSQSNAPQSQGKLVFGSNANRSKETGKVILLLDCFLLIFQVICLLLPPDSSYPFDGNWWNSSQAKEAKQEPPKEKEESKFQPFTGKKYSLRGWLLILNAF